MLVRRINGCTAVIGEEQGYLNLPIRQGLEDKIIDGNIHRVVTTDTAWEPTPEELKRLNDGHSIIISLLLFGQAYPPISVYVDESPDEPAMNTRSKAICGVVDSLEKAILEYKKMMESGELSVDQATKTVAEYQALIVTLSMFQGWPK